MDSARQLAGFFLFAFARRRSPIGQPDPSAPSSSSADRDANEKAGVKAGLVQSIRVCAGRLNASPLQSRLLVGADGEIHTLDGGAGRALAEIIEPRHGHETFFVAEHE